MTRWVVIAAIVAHLMKSNVGATKNITDDHSTSLEEEEEIFSGNPLTPRKKKKKIWRNWLDTINVGGEFEKIFQPRNRGIAATVRIQSQEFLSGLQALQDTIAQAVSDGKRLRAYGSKWGLSNCAYVDDYLIESWGLNYLKIGIGEGNEANHVTAPYQVSGPNRLVFAQAGVMIQEIHKALFARGLALSTTGAGDGQRIAGAISTGVHGSNNQIGAMQDFTKGLHIVTNDRHVFIQKSSDPVVTQEFTTWLGGAQLISDDDMFHAALISFGSFGIIHGVLFEVEPIYRLQGQVKVVNYDDHRDTLARMDVQKLFPVSNMPIHFEMTINPYKNRKGAITRVFEKIPIAPGEALPEASGDIFGANMYQELSESFARGVGLMASTVSVFFRKRLYNHGVDIAIRSFFKPRQHEEPTVAYPFEFFTFSRASQESGGSPVPGIGTEIGVPQSRVGEALDVILKIIDKDPIPGPVSVRFVKSSQATLAFTNFPNENLVATIELSAPYGKLVFRNTWRIYEKIFQAFYDSGIPYSYHWGQALPMRGDWVSRCFGNRLTQWKDQRRILLDATGRYTFSNAMMDDLGLSE